MLTVLLTGAVAFIITFMVIPGIMRVAEEKKMFDVPDARKLHNKPIASLGGVGIFIGSLLSFLLCATNKEYPEFRYFFAASLVTFFLGLKDDILVISPIKKFLGQLAAAAIIIHLGNIRLDSMYGILGIYHLPDIISYILTYITIIVVGNAYNLIDGVDGLSGTLGVLTTGVFGIYFYQVGIPAYALFSFAFTGSLLAFLCFNFNPAKIFMGDSGALLLGMVNSILVIKFIAVANTTGTSLPIASSVAIGFSILLVPLLDTLRVFSIRILKGRSPFSPDRLHIHHLLLDRGFNHRQVTFICFFLNSSFILIAYAGQSMGSNYLLLLQFVVFYSLVAMLYYFKKPKPALALVGAPVTKQYPPKKEVAAKAPTKLVSLTSDTSAESNSL